MKNSRTRSLFFCLAFFLFRKIRDMFSLKQPDQSGWKNFRPAALVAPPLLPQPPLSFSLQPFSTPTKRANISRQPKGVSKCLQFKSQDHFSCYFSRGLRAARLCAERRVGGARRVVASLWQVDDRATAQLMGHFYRGMLKENLRPAAALRAAQIEMSRNPRWSSPYYWAGFVMQGEWR
jgi:hypothetical protein